MKKGQFTWHKIAIQMEVFKSKISSQTNNLQTFRQTLKSLVITATWLAVNSVFIHKSHNYLPYITSVLNCIISSKWDEKVFSTFNTPAARSTISISKWQLQFWSEILLVIWNQTHTAYFSDFKKMCMISDQNCTPLYTITINLFILEDASKLLIPHIVDQFVGFVIYHSSALPNSFIDLAACSACELLLHVV